MSRFRKKIVAFTFAIVGLFIISTIILNFRPFTSVLLGIEPLIHVYHYQSSNCTFHATEYPEKGAGFDYIYNNFTDKQKRGEIPNDVTLCRLFRKNYLKFWKWRDYLTNDRWKLEYMDPCP